MGMAMTVLEHKAQGTARAATAAAQPHHVDEPRRRRARRECTVIDVSPGGAKIVTDAAIDVRDRFGLTLTPEHSGRYECEVVWRRGKTYGVKFVQ